MFQVVEKRGGREEGRESQGPQEAQHERECRVILFCFTQAWARMPRDIDRLTKVRKFHISFLLECYMILIVRKCCITSSERCDNTSYVRKCGKNLLICENAAIWVVSTRRNKSWHNLLSEMQLVRWMSYKIHNICCICFISY